MEEENFKGKYMQLGPSEKEIKIDFKRVGPSTNPQANQLRDMNIDANWGTKNIELGWLSPTVMFKTPEEHFHELRRLSKVTGVKTTIHAPIINLAGRHHEGGLYSEDNRQEQENILKMTIDNSKKVFGDRRGLVNIHASEAAPGKVSYIKEGKEVEEAVFFIDQDSRKVLGIPREKILKHGELVEVDPRTFIKDYEGREIGSMFQKLAELDRQKGIYKREIEKLRPVMDHLRNEKIPESEKEPYKTEYPGLKEEFYRGEEHLHSIEEAMERYRKEIEKTSKIYNKNLKKFDGNIGKYVKSVEKKHGNIENYIKKRAEEKYSYLKKIDKGEFSGRVKRDVDALKGRFKNFGFLYPEEELEKYKPVIDYEREHASETIKNAALHSYRKYGDKAPVLSVENPFGFLSSGRPEDLLKLVNTAREKMTKDLVSRDKMGKSGAEKLAKQMIGVTWDVGHINMLKRFGFDDKRILDEFKKLNDAGVIKHVHLTDNFGYEDTHFAPGQGNVPTKEFLKELEKKGYKGDFVIEAGGSEAMMGEGNEKDYSLHPLPQSLSFLGSGSYGMEPSGERWTDFQDEFNRLYSSGMEPPRESFGGDFYGNISYGSFTGVPSVFGSSTGDKKSKFSGSEMA